MATNLEDRMCFSLLSYTADQRLIDLHNQSWGFRDLVRSAARMLPRSIYL